MYRPIEADTAFWDEVIDHLSEVTELVFEETNTMDLINLLRRFKAIDVLLYYDRNENVLIECNEPKEELWQFEPNLWN